MMRESWRWAMVAGLLGCVGSLDGPNETPQPSDTDMANPGDDTGDADPTDSGEDTSVPDSGVDDSDASDTDGPPSDDSDPDPSDTDPSDTDVSSAEEPEDWLSSCVDGVPSGDGFEGATWVDLAPTPAPWFRDHPVVRITNTAQWERFVAHAELADATVPVDFDYQQLVVMSYYASATCGISEISAWVTAFGFAAQPYIEWRLRDSSLGCPSACDMLVQRVRAMALPKTAASFALTPQVCLVVEPGCSED